MDKQEYCLKSQIVL